MIARWRDGALALWLVRAALAMVVPVSPGMPSAGSDAAWLFGLLGEWVEVPVDRSALMV